MHILPPVTPAVSPSFSTAAFNVPRERFAMTPISALLALGQSCTRAEILTYTAIQLHADKDTGHCNPGRETLALITGLPENRITKATTSLEKKGFIRKEQPDPFHVHYFVLPPPVIEPVEPRARFRPPLKPSPVPPAEPNQCHQRHEPVPPTAPLTDQWTDQEEKREPTPDPERIEPAPPAQAPLPQSPLRTAKTEAPESVPESWIDQAALMRPELPTETIRASAEKFLDHNRAKGTVLADWLPAWRNWIRRERAVKPHQTATTATQPANRYAHLDAKEQPVSAAVRNALAISEQNRIAMLIQRGIDPVTGFPIATTTSATAAQAATPITDQADQSYEARLAALEARIAARKEREAAEREGGPCT